MTILLAVLANLLQADPEWVETRFHRVHLVNGRFIDGHLAKSTPEAVILRVRSGELIVRRDSVDRVELVTMRNVREKPEPVPPPPAPAVAVERPAVAVPVTSSLEMLERVEGVLHQAAALDGARRARLLESLTELGDAGAVALAERLDRVPRSLLPEAGALLRRWRSEAAVPALEAQVGSGSAFVRREAALALAAIAGEKASVALLPLLGDEDPLVRLAGVEALDQGGCAEALARVAALAADNDGRVRTRALTVAFRWADDRPKRERLHDALVEALGAAGPGARAEILRSLAVVWPERGLAVVSRALWDEDVATRRSAAVAMGSFHPSQAAGPVLERLPAERDAEARLQLASLVDRMQLKGAVETLIEWLADEDERIRKAASEVLQSLTRRNFGEDPGPWRAWWSTRTANP